MPGIDDDWFPPMYVQRLYTQDEARSVLRSSWGEGHIPRSVMEGIQKAPPMNGGPQ